MNGCASICTRDKKTKRHKQHAPRDTTMSYYGGLLRSVSGLSYDIVNKQPRRALSVRLGAVRYDSISDSIPHGVILT